MFFFFQDMFEIKTELKESDYCTSIHQVSCHLSKVAVAGFLTFVLIFRTAIRPPNVKTPSTIASNQPAGIQTRPTALSQMIMSGFRFSKSCLARTKREELNKTSGAQCAAILSSLSGFSSGLLTVQVNVATLRHHKT